MGAGLVIQEALWKNRLSMTVRSLRSIPEVHRFGGASLNDAQAYRGAVEIVRSRQAHSVVVVSAPGDTANALLRLAHDALQGRQASDLKAGADALRAQLHDVLSALVPETTLRAEVAAVIDKSFDELDALVYGLLMLRELTPRTSDFITSRGDRLAAQIFAAALRATGRRARYVEASDVIITDGPFGGASPDLAATDLAVKRMVAPLLGSGITPVLPGSIGAAPAQGDEAGRSGPQPAVSLGRGGADLTATLLGRALGAQGVFLWKDVPGLLTADPAVVPNARVIPQLNIREASELAFYGAEVLHPRVLIPVIGRDIPVYVRPFAQPGESGTEISARQTLDRYPVKALSSIPGQALVTVTGSGMLGVPGIAARTFSALHQDGISVSLISQSSSEQSICFSIPESAARSAQHRIEAIFKDEIGRGEIDRITVETGLATLAVVGLGMKGAPGIASRVFGAAAASGANIIAIAQGSSELNISLVVSAPEAPAALRAIHDEFQLAKIGGGTAARAEHVDVVLLGLGAVGRALAGLLTESASRLSRHQGSLRSPMMGGRPARASAAKTPTVRLVAVTDQSGFVFAPDGLATAAVAALASACAAGRALSSAPQGQKGSPADALSFLARHALSSPILVDTTDEDTGEVLKQALSSGMDLVLANPRPLSARRKEHDALHALAERQGCRIRMEATAGAALPVLDTYQKLVESGDRVTKIEAALSGAVGHVLAEVSGGRLFSEALREAVGRGLTSPDPRHDLAGADVGRKALILARLLGFTGEPDDVDVESLVFAGGERLTREQFLKRCASADADWQKRAKAAQTRGLVLRYLATITQSAVKVGVRAVPRTSSFGALLGTDSQVAFTTARYRETPLVISGPGEGADVTAAGVLNDILDLV